MNWQVFLSESAREDLEEARNWSESRQAGLGSDFLVEVESILELLEQNPKIFPVRSESVRGGPLRRFPYLIFYRIQDLSVEVIAIANTSRKPRQWDGEA